MPEMPILNERGHLLVIAPIIVMSTAMYPADEDARYELISNNIVRLGSELGITSADLYSVLSEALIPYLYHAPSPDEVMRKLSRAIRNAWLADEVLRILLRIAVHHPGERAEVIRAFWLIDQTSERPLADRTKWRIWKTFRSVAHLNIASTLLRKRLSIDTIGPDTFRRIYVEHFLDYLAMAESIRELAIRHRLIAPEETWYTPAGLTLASCRVEIPPLSPDSLRLLAQYSPAHEKRPGSS